MKMPTAAEIQLAAGELTAGEMRTVKAVLKWFISTRCNEADQRDTVLEEVAEVFSKQARDMQMSFEQRALMTVAERIRALKRQPVSEESK